MILKTLFNDSMKFINSFFMQNASFVLGYISPFKIGGILAKPLIIKKYTSIKPKDTLFSTFVEIVLDLLWQVALFPILFIFVGKKFFDSHEFLISFILVAISIIIFMILIINKDLSLRIVGLFFRLMPKKFNIVKKIYKGKNWVETSISKLRLLFSDKRFMFKFFILTVVLLFLNPLVLFFTFKMYSLSLGYFVALSLYWLTFIIGRLSGLPGGLGARDASLGFLLIALGVDASLSVKVTVVSRLILMLPHLGFGIPALVYYGTNGMIKKFRKDVS